MSTNSPRSGVASERVRRLVDDASAGRGLITNSTAPNPAGLQEHVARLRRVLPEMRLTPSEYFACQCWVRFEVDEPTLPALVPFIVTAASWDRRPAPRRHVPRRGEELREVIEPLPDATQAKILGTNAAELYRLAG